MTIRVDNARGFTLIELVIIILVIGVIGTIATVRMTESVETARFEQTRREMDELARAIVGNPEVVVDGIRSDFGFVGDNGVLPSSLDELVSNPGGWTTWDGPYMSPGFGGDEFRKDAWNSNYLLIGTSLRSTGSGSSLDRVYADSPEALLNNVVRGWVKDASGDAPPPAFVDSIQIELNYPNGAGSFASTATSPSTGGAFNFNSVPIGRHNLRVIYLPQHDTLRVPLAVSPARDAVLDIVFPTDLW